MRSVRWCAGVARINGRPSGGAVAHGRGRLGVGLRRWGVVPIRLGRGRPRPRRRGLPRSQGQGLECSKIVRARFYCVDGKDHSHVGAVSRRALLTTIAPNWRSVFNGDVERREIGGIRCNEVEARLEANLAGG